MDIKEFLAALIVSIAWGCTNPLIKRATAKVSASWSAWLQQPQFVCAQAVNQLGSLLFTVLLGSGAPLAVVVPAANAGAFAFNALVDLGLGERYTSSLLVPGVLLVGVGVLLCSLG